MHLLKKPIIIISILIVLLLGGYTYIIAGLPSLVTLDDYQPNLVTTVYARDGRVIGEFCLEKRVVVPFERVPKHLINAFLAAEDSKFYEHKGISYSGILRAMGKNLLAGRFVQGGSTITQQLAKTFFLTPERKLSRKVKEAIMAYRIEKHLKKDEILHLYLNQIYFGNGAYGVQTASESYFGKNVQDIDLAEAAFLAGLPKAPNKYSPYTNFEAAKQRQEFVLSRMVEEQLISPEDGQKAIRKKLNFKPRRAESLWVGPYFTEHVRRHLEEAFGEELLYKKGMKVYTTLDVDMQKAANIAVREGLREHDKRRGYRGPKRVLKTDEEAEAFTTEAARRFVYDPIEAGEIYEALITHVNTRDMALRVDLGGRTGSIATADMEWAGLYNTSGEADGGRQAELKTLFHKGDVIEVQVKSLPAGKNSVIPLRLEQEPQAQASLMAMEPETGMVRAMVGGADFSKTQFNRATQAKRQPGSSFKPIVYTAAIDRGYTPATIVIDSPIVFDEAIKDEAWRPRNYDEQFYGPTTVREALAKSRNIITIKILKDIGIDYALTYANALGITSPLARDLSLALGSSAVTLSEMTTAFATLANMGSRPTQIYLTRVTDSSGKVLEENQSSSTAAVTPQTAYLMTSLMQSVIEGGTGSRARALGRPAAGKTGTTNNLNDAWFMGYVPGLVAGSWVGYDSEKPLGHGETGSTAALPIWLRFMQGATARMAVRSFTVPEGLEFTKIDPETGLLATSATQDAIFEVFKEGTAPKEYSSGASKTHSSDFLMIDSDSKGQRQKRVDPETPID
ncbi:MAG: PBP1A family penicillin-binding protein [Deltaproteobacteria bacterium]